ncbi:MAG: glycoside hydrolase family 38 [Phycisphaerae bacterium]|nr:glycoside hydrolase family 38 [Phycisphaerae bacterium]
MSSPSKQIAHYVASTHWDREWYESFQNYRYRLVAVLDEVLDTMIADEGYAYWHSDGQVALIEDYLEIRPERRADIERLAQTGRLRIGPWYVLPDEFLVSGESLIRNFQLGLETAATFGRPARAGYVCDMFGHISQLPQILRGFGIDNAFLYRGIHVEATGAVFRWRGADGSEVLAYRFGPQGGYGQYSYHVREAGDPTQPFQLDRAMARLRDFVDLEKKRSPGLPLLLMDGVDHIEIEPRVVELHRRANQAFEDVEIVHSHLEGYVEDLREHREQITFVAEGELRHPGAKDDGGNTIFGVLASRVGLKQANARCENELCGWAEPFAAFAAGLGREYPHGFLRTAWRHLLLNHPHDSICGCSIDQVHKDMVYRFDQAEQIAGRIASESLRHIALQVQRPELGEKDFMVVVFNATGEAIDGPVDLTLGLPADIDTTFQEGMGYEPRVAFRLYDTEGAELVYQRVQQRRNRQHFYLTRGKFPKGELRTEVDVTVPLRVPAYGYTTLTCRPIKEPTRHLGTMLVDDHTIENEHLVVRVQPNGTVNVTDKRNNAMYNDLLTFEDRADIGDGWYHGEAVNDEQYSSTAAGADVALVADGVGKATFKIGVTMQVPRAFDFHTMTRSGELAPLRITSYVTLRRGAEHVEVRTVVENTIRDHRLRVLLPTGLKADMYFADSAFDVIERPIALRPDAASQPELETETRPQATWTAVCESAGAARGLAVVSTGLYETAVRDLPSRPIALTLLRSFCKTVLTSGEEGGEIQGTHEFRYAIVPFDGELPRTKLFGLGQLVASAPRSVQLVARDTASAPKPTLPPTQAFVSLTPGDAVVTAIQQRPDADGLVIRLFNPTTEPLTETIELPTAITSAERISFEGESNGALNVSGRKITVALPPKRIETVRIVCH